MAVKTWGTGGDYATIALALVYAEGLGAFTEDLELRQNSDTTWTDSADYSYDLTGVEMNGYTLSITNPDGYKSTWGTQDALEFFVWKSVKNGVTGKFIVDGLDVDHLSWATIYSYGNDQQFILRNCKWQFKSNAGTSVVLSTQFTLDNSSQYLRVYNCSFVNSGAGTAALFGGVVSDNVGVKTFENVTAMGFDLVTTKTLTTCIYTNCFLDSVDAEKQSGTYVSCATTDDTTDIPANLRSLVLADMFEKYLIEDYDDPDYLKPKSGTVLTSEATYPPTTIGHTLFFDGVEITAELAIIGYRYITVVPPLEFIVQPLSQYLSIGEGLTLSYVAIGGEPAISDYTSVWKKEGINIIGATENPFVISSIKSSDYGDYTVEVSDGSQSILSDVAIVTYSGSSSSFSRPGPATFLVEFPKGESTSFASTSVAIHKNPAGAIIHAISVAPYPTSSYWLDWGGVYDNPLDSFFVIFITRFLLRVDTIEQLLLNEFSSVIVGDTVYFRTPFFPWQYNELLRKIEFLYGFSTNVPDPNYPSNDKYGGEHYPTKLQVPNLPIALSNPVNGIFLTPNFSIILFNNDGFFDFQNSKDIMNTPVVIRKSTSVPATIDTFKKIRQGDIENAFLTEETYTIIGSDILRTLEQPVTRTLEEAGFVGGGVNMPVAYGSIRKANLIKSGDGEYVACDPDYLVDVTAVYNGDGDEIAFTKLLNGKIAANDSASKVDFLGLPENSIGEIIIKELNSKSNILYDDFFWNTEETDVYILNSYSVDFLFNEGTVKSLVTKLLKNDMAFLIQQNDGRLTLRKWGETYTQHIMPSWIITQEPSRKLSDYKFYSSSVIIRYLVSEGEAQASYLNTDFELEAIAQWKKKTRLTHNTELVDEGSAWDFSMELLNRFASRPELWSIGTGIDTATIELLDSLVLEIVIGNKTEKRVLSKVLDWKIVGVNPSQDVLQLEEDTTIKEVESESGILIAQPSSEFDNGGLSQPSSIEADGLLSQQPVG